MFVPFRRYVTPSRQFAPRVIWRDDVSIATGPQSCRLDGIPVRMCLGKWAFFIPATGEKFLHARDGATDTLSHAKPDLAAGPAATLRYEYDEWRRALTTPVDHRVAELWVVMKRLWAAGLGPEPLGFTFTNSYVRDGVRMGATAGLISENVERLPRKLRCREQDLAEAGVQIDKFRASVRQQLRGYVIDLNAAVGLTPIDGEADVAQTLARIGDLRAQRAAAAAPVIEAPALEAALH